MSLLRIYCSSRDAPRQCQWALVSEGREPVLGEGPLAQLPQRAERVQLRVEYRAQQWDRVEVNLLNLQRLYPGRDLYALYASRVANFRRTPPPPGWDGVTAFDEK